MRFGILVRFFAVQGFDGVLKIHEAISISLASCLLPINQSKMWTKWIARRPVTKSAFRKFGKVSAKNVSNVKSVILGNKKLKSVVNKVFSKKGLALTTTVTTIAVASTYINDYIQSNSGCFLTQRDSVCKVQELSCCQPQAVENLRLCPVSKLAVGDPCHGFEEDKENSCCRHCNCKEYDCLPHQTMQCRRPSIGEALSHFAGGITSNLGSLLGIILPWLYTAACVLVGLVVLWITYFTFNKVR